MEVKKNKKGLGLALEQFKVRKPLAFVLSMWATQVMATTYELDPDYQGPNAAVCIAVRDALNVAAISDEQDPFCKRRLKITRDGADFGLDPVPMQQIDISTHRDLLVQMLAINSEYQTHSDQEKRQRAEAAADRVIKSNLISIYLTSFDPDNGGKVRQIFVMDEASCIVESVANPSYPVVFMERSPGILDPYWGRGAFTAGFPFFFERRTYYAKWDSQGEVLNGDRARLLIYEAIPDNETSRKMSRQEGFGVKCALQQKLNRK